MNANLFEELSSLRGLTRPIDVIRTRSQTHCHMSKRIHIATYGCQMNEYESDRTFRLFHDKEGYEWTHDPTKADLVLYNTCSIRDKADQKAFSAIGLLRSTKLTRPEMVIAVGGCMAQMQGKEIQKKFPYVDLVFGTHQWNHLPELVRKVQVEKEKILEIDLYGWKNYNFLPYRQSVASHPISEFVTIQNGCNKFCTFCLVPFTRGREMSRSPKEIMEEVHELANMGVREVMLLGQNVNAYGKDQRFDLSFTDLLKKVCEINGLERLRFMTSHPAELTFEMIDVMADQEKICEHLHLPLQSGSDMILQKMNRGYDMAQYRKIVQYLRKKIPTLSLTTDLIVAFPGETEENFERTLDAIREFEFEDSFSFCYSPRPHTKAAQWTEAFNPPEVCNERLSRLQKLQNEIRDRKNQAWVGKEVQVLVEGEAKKGEGMLTGKNRENVAVNFLGTKDWIGKLIDVKITKALPHSLLGATL